MVVNSPQMSLKRQLKQRLLGRIMVGCVFLLCNSSAIAEILPDLNKQRFGVETFIYTRPMTPAEESMYIQPATPIDSATENHCDPKWAALIYHLKRQQGFDQAFSWQVVQESGFFDGSETCYARVKKVVWSDSTYRNMRAEFK